MPLVMIVDDEKYVRESLGKILNKEGYEIRSSASGDEALNLLSEIKPDVILLDFKMPGLDGVEVCKRIRANANTRDIPIIMITAYPHEKTEALICVLNVF